MSSFNSEVALEAVSALLGTPVKAYDGAKGTLGSNGLNVIMFLFGVLVRSRIFDHLRDSKQTVTGTSISGLRDELFVDMDEFFDPKYDFDFTHLNDKSTCMRGNEAYKRPCGWYRIALKVLDKYPDGNVWLGTDGWRSHSVAGEWPVSYHGTSIEGAKGIVTSHYKAGPRDLYGRGIYSTYDIDQASGYSREFTSKINGKTYRVMMQNRINPQMRKVCDRKDYWLIEIPEGTSSEKEREIVEKSIRPYAILIKEVS